MMDSSQYVVRALLAEQVIKDPDATRAQDHAASHGWDITDSLVELGLISSRRLALERAKICECPFVELTHYEVDFANTKLAPKGVLERLTAFPLFIVDRVATVGMVDPLNLAAIDQLRQHLRMDVEPVLCDAEQLRGLIARAYGMRGSESSTSPEAADAEADLTTGDEPIVLAVNQILMGAIDSEASDIHINPDDHEVHLRYRVDGILVSQQGPAKQWHAGIVQRLKVLARLDLTQTRKPQDGKFRFTHREQAVDFRLSVVPTIHGENVVMRILRSANRIGSLRDLEMPKEMTRAYEEAIVQPHGMILVTGPTGSGKTTTLYTALAHINSPDKNILTIEDPVEIRLPMVRQVQVNAEIGLTFVSALRSILRQDPDVVLVGEIRDEETARIAVQAALTGHLVLSTLHTNDAASSVTRLKDLGVQSFAINSALLCAVAQRLLRRVCNTCACPDQVQTSELRRLGIDPLKAPMFRRGAGCSACRSTGYHGRVGVFEMLKMTPAIQRLIERGESRSAIVAQARREGMTFLMDDAVNKAAAGQTTLSEISRLVATEIDEDDARAIA